MQIVYARNWFVTDYMSDKPIFLNNCGVYSDLDTNIFVNRKNGRKDYHLLLVSSGRIFAEGQELLPGHAYMYFPSTPQHYYYEIGEGSEYYWLHFSGSLIPSLIESYGLHEGMYDLGTSKGDGVRIIKMMIRALTEEYRYADEFCEGLLNSLLALVGAPPTVNSFYYRAMKLLGDPANDKSIEEIASLYNMSPNHFIRSFKQYVGVSPNSYRIGKRMEIACEMLISTDLGIEQIAGAAGYTDPLYFSRAFRKHTGLSPSEFRKRKRT